MTLEQFWLASISFLCGLATESLIRFIINAVRAARKLPVTGKLPRSWVK